MRHPAGVQILSVNTGNESVRARLMPVLRQAWSDLVYLSFGLATSIVALAVWVTGVTVTLSLLLFIVGIPAVLVAAAAFRWSADLDRCNTARALGAPLRSQYRPRDAPRLLARLSATIHDPQTFRDLGWLVIHSVVGMAFGATALAAVANAVGLGTLPLWFWALPAGADYWGFLPIGQLWGALAGCVLAVPLSVLSVVLLRVMTIGEVRLAVALLGPPAASAAVADPVRRARRDPGATLPLHVAVAVVVIFACTVVWLLTTGSYFWPVWVALGLSLTAAGHDALARAAHAGEDRLPRVISTLEISVVVVGVCVAVWALAGGGSLWPVWPALGLSTIVAIFALVVYRDRLPWVRERELEERVDELTRTRRGALDAQAAELRRIERDLHDGAQARLVSLSMLMGRAEDRLSDNPQAAALVRQARDEASAAIAELRDLARGISPPVLVDRGLLAAVESLAARVPITVTIDASTQLPRPSPAIETAAYFVVAESVTNSTKHAGGKAVHVTVRKPGDMLVVEIADDGPGGADPAGSGLTGLRHRVEALDGTLHIGSGASGRGTVIRAELPCES